ncbi:MAG: dihydroorotase, partial [Eubacteriales bacterium]|nr:dihydroorotase [Eubacteriales bacterium]
MKLLIKNGTVIGNSKAVMGKLDILAEDGIITRISENIVCTEAEVVDAAGKTVIPGLVDAHCHLREPGSEHMEDIESGTKSAAAGGFTSVACMPNTNPVIDNEAVVRYIKSRAEEIGAVNVFPIGAISKGLEGKELAEIGELKMAGAVGISDDGNPLMDSSLMKKAMLYSSMFDIRVISHCEDKCLTEDGVMNEGYESTLLGLKGIPAAAEEVMVARELILSEYTNVPVHIAHVSTSVSVDMIREAKKKNVSVTAETCPHYFTLTEEMCRGYNTNAKVNPPLRTKKDVESIIEGLR